MVLETELTVKSDLDLLPQVVTWFEQFNIPTFPSQQWQQANLALIEGFTNAVRHAHGSQHAHVPLSLKASLSEELFWLEIWDQGAPYDFDRAMGALNQTLNAVDFDPLEREKKWGSVIFLRLVQKFHWQIQYSRYHESQNCFRAEVDLDYKEQT